MVWIASSLALLAMTGRCAQRSCFDRFARRAKTCQSLAAKIFLFIRILNYRITIRPTRHEGRSYVVTKRGLGMRWTRQRRAREGVAGRACARERSAGAQTNGAEKRLRLASRVSTRQPSKAGRGRPRTAKSCGPGARSWRQACGSVSPRPGMRREESARRRWQ